MQKNNLQIRISEEMNKAIAELSPKSKSDFVRQAIEEKIQKEKAKKFEEQWISALKKKPESTQEAKQWLQIESWEKP